VAAVAAVAEGKASWKTGGGLKALAAIANPPVAPASLTVCLSFYSITYLIYFDLLIAIEQIFCVD
jgi:hypothetical protein